MIETLIREKAVSRIEGSSVCADSMFAGSASASSEADSRARQLAERVLAVLCEADREILKDGGEISSDLEQRIQTAIADCILAMH